MSKKYAFHQVNFIDLITLCAQEIFFGCKSNLTSTRKINILFLVLLFLSQFVNIFFFFFLKKYIQVFSQLKITFLSLKLNLNFRNISRFNYI